MRKFRQACQMLNLDNSSDSEVLSCETTLSSNDVKLQLTIRKSDGDVHEGEPGEK